MILNNNVFDQLLSKEGQKREFERLQNAQVGDVLFVTAVYKNADIEETLLHKAGIHFGIRIANGKVVYVKTK